MRAAARLEALFPGAFLAEFAHRTLEECLGSGLDCLLEPLCFFGGDEAEADLLVDDPRPHRHQLSLGHLEITPGAFEDFCQARGFEP